MTMAPGKIHSHRSEEADPLAAGDGEDAVGDSEGGSVNGEGAGVAGWSWLSAGSGRLCCWPRGSSYHEGDWGGGGEPFRPGRQRVPAKQQGRRDGQAGTLTTSPRGPALTPVGLFVQFRWRRRPKRESPRPLCCATPGRPRTLPAGESRSQKATEDTGGITSQPYTQGQAPLSAIFCWASAIAPLRACTWWPSASPMTFLMGRVTAGTTLAAAECG